MTEKRQHIFFIKLCYYFILFLFSFVRFNKNYENQSEQKLINNLHNILTYISGIRRERGRTILPTIYIFQKSLLARFSLCRYIFIGNFEQYNKKTSVAFSMGHIKKFFIINLLQPLPLD
uniref:Uncharacterized protein n=1 Tax=Cacopsylla melanoneura TaxID=428564 RepID=A0A8D8X3W7_9HEMI